MSECERTPEGTILERVVLESDLSFTKRGGGGVDGGVKDSKLHVEIDHNYCQKM